MPPPTTATSARVLSVSGLRMESGEASSHSDRWSPRSCLGLAGASTRTSCPPPGPANRERARPGIPTRAPRGRRPAPSGTAEREVEAGATAGVGDVALRVGLEEVGDHLLLRRRA